MTPDLRQAIDAFYEAFPDRREGRPVVGCMHCLASRRALEFARELGTADRRAIPDEALSWFAFKAITTIGDDSDLLSLLPPIFERISEGALGIDPQIPFGKLPMAGVEAWPTHQRAAVDSFLLAWMGVATRESGVPANGPDVVECAAMAGFALEPLLAAWEQAESVDAFTDLAHEMLGSQWMFAENDVPAARDAYVQWLTGPTARNVLARALATHPDDWGAGVWEEALAK